MPINQFQLLDGDIVQLIAGQIQNLLAHTFSGGIDRIAGHNRAAAGEGPRAPMELVGITGDDIDIGHFDA